MCFKWFIHTFVELTWFIKFVITCRKVSVAILNVFVVSTFVRQKKERGGGVRPPVSTNDIGSGTIIFTLG